MRPRLDKHALFRDVGYTPHPGQLAVHESSAPRRVLACGVRWGKTKCAVMEVVAALLEPRDRDTLGWVVGPDHTVADRILRQAHAVLEARVPRRIINYKNHALRIHNLAGRVAVAEGRSGENPASLLGEGLDWLVVDEAARLKDEIWNEHLSQRLVERRGWALILSTPRGKSWFYASFKLGQRGDPAYASWTGPTWDNPHIDRDAVEAERKRLDPDVFSQEFEGKFVGAGIVQCETCGYPRQECGPIPLFPNGEKPGACAECGREVALDGRSLYFDSGGLIIAQSLTLLEITHRPRDPSHGDQQPEDDACEGVPG